MVHLKNIFITIGMVTNFFLVGLASCSNKGDDKKSQKPETEISASTSVTENVIFQDVQGKTVSLHELKGKVVFINFWATWCPPCIHEMSSINKLKSTFDENENIVFLMVDMDQNFKKSIPFMEKNKYNLPVYITKSEIPGELFSGALPTTIILNKNGEIEARILGGQDYSSPAIVKTLKELTEEK